MLTVRRFPESTAPCGRGVCHYRGNQPLLRYTPIADAACIAEATRYNRETLPQGIVCGNKVETAAEGQSLQQQGKPHINRVEPRQAKSD